jgi:hypothetical protein
VGPFLLPTGHGTGPCATPLLPIRIGSGEQRPRVRARHAGYSARQQIGSAVRCRSLWPLSSFRRRQRVAADMQPHAANAARLKARVGFVPGRHLRAVKEEEAQTFSKAKGLLFAEEPSATLPFHLALPRPGPCHPFNTRGCTNINF